MKVTILCLRIIQLVLALGTLGSAITVVHWFNMNSGKASPGAFNILVAVPLIALLSSFTSRLSLELPLVRRLRCPILAGISVPWWVLSTILLVNQMFTHGFRRPSATRPAMSQA
ncbi:unnamed protein product [Parascedosporium putredinis]|uniref:Uncharacterized protein n=1 Tax=Parascedosporium putredinis TaxID=1442378 RepID=A0A9P1H918_9PEZI|nr:unnamed protein product [Parascedosporium putredinis]CAI8001257.1 unnamed protein product [Parascedosporium putredinis]